MSSRLELLIDYAKERYDYILIDTAPIGLVSDTYLLNRIADNSIFVARQDYTPKEASILINEIYEEKRLNGMGVVLNGTYTTSGYGYGYGNSSKEDKKKRYKIPNLTFDERLRDYYQMYKDKRGNKK
jgi:Mrp family chromosome partitioning ATPase